MKRQLKFLTILISLLWTIKSLSFESLRSLISSITGVCDRPKHIDTTTRLATKANQKELKKNSICNTNGQKLEKSNNNIVSDIENSKQILSISNRFIELFNSHNIHINEIPRCIPAKFNLTLTDLLTEKSLICKLDSELIEWVCNWFGIRRSWMETGDGSIYDTINYYNSGVNLLKHFKMLKSEFGHQESFTVYLFKSVDEFYGKDERGQYINFLIVIPHFRIGDKIIYKYIPTSTQWDWGYWDSRFRIKGITMLSRKKLSLFFEGHDLNMKKMNELSSGIIFPKLILDEIKSGITWNPEDYTYGDYANCAKDTYELKMVKEHITELGYYDAFKKQNSKMSNITNTLNHIC